MSLEKLAPLGAYLENRRHEPNTDPLQKRRKVPRCILAHKARTSPAPPLLGASLLWSDRTETSVLDVNLTGIVLSKQGRLIEFLSENRIKKGQVVPLMLHFEDASHVEVSRQLLAIRILDIEADFVTGMFDSVSTGGRVHLDQEAKDSVVLANWHLLRTQNLDLQFQNSYWFHGPFDTNLVVTSDNSGWLEYDGLLFHWNPNGTQIFKAQSSANEGDLYSHLWAQPPTSKISMGASWKERWLQLLESMCLQVPSQGLSQGKQDGQVPDSRQVLIKTLQHLRTL